MSVIELSWTANKGQTMSVIELSWTVKKTIESANKGLFQTCEAVTRQRKRDSESQRKIFSLIMILNFSNPIVLIA